MEQLKFNDRAKFMGEIMDELKKPKWRKWLAIGLAIGMMFGAVAALIRNHVQRHCLQPSVVEQMTIQLPKNVKNRR